MTHFGPLFIFDFGLQSRDHRHQMAVLMRRHDITESRSSYG